MLTSLTCFEGSRRAGATSQQPHRPTITRKTLSRIKSKLVPFERAPLSLDTLAQHMQSKEPVLLETRNFDVAMVKTQLLQYCATDNSWYRGLGGHTKLKLKDVFNFQNTANPHRIEELPEDVQGEVARDIPSRILQSMLPAGSPSLLLWKEALRVAADLSKHCDDQPRETMIVTGCCKDLREPVHVGAHGSGLIVTKDKQVAPCHFDQWQALISCWSGTKTVRLCPPLALLCKRTTAAKGGERSGKTRGTQINERPDIDARFCCNVDWRKFVLTAGQVMVLPCDWWHEVCPHPSTVHTLGVRAAEVSSLQVETGNTCSWTMTIWFRLNNDEAPQIAHLLANEAEELASCARSSPDSTRVAEHHPVHTITASAVAPVVRALLPATPTSGEGGGARKPGSGAANASLAAACSDVSPACAWALPHDFDAFKPGNVFKLCTLDTLRPAVLPAAGLLDGIARYLLFKWSQVVKDKDSALRNATTTNTVVPEGEKAVHTNCIAHTHMHVHKIGAVTGTLPNKEALPYAKKWLKIIDEHNKVSTLAHPQHAHAHSLCSWRNSIRPMYACEYRIGPMCP